MVNNQGSIDRRIRRTKRLIKDALLVLLRDKNLSQITVSELCEAADINRKSFYNHYADIHTVLGEIEDDYVQKISSFLNQENILYDIEDPYPFISKLTGEIQSNAGLYKLLLEAGECANLVQKMNASLCMHLRDVMEESTYIDHETFLFYINFISAGILAVYQQWFASSEAMSMEKLSSLICKAVCDGGSALRQE